MRRAVVVALALGFAAPASAAAFWQFRGHIADRKRTTIQLVVSHRGDHPRSIEDLATGRLLLACENGEARTHFPGFNLPLDSHGEFAVSGIAGSISIGPGGKRRRSDRRFSIRGAVHRRRAVGFLRLHTNNHGPKGKCDSGLLRWRARFVPRS